ncbi:MAG TPA: gluconate 2-dehydrogenase subunit 3 family protein [Sphingomonas sp.]|jgi:hypothetical protein|uniref:gluconate 2-dehydrogenase subunit 3 family protein n=1 Tax=Sphingomonas sp. TaxID=28214 RepID=UPI002ED95224
MADKALGQFDRRQLIGSGAVLAALIGTPLWIWQRARSGERGEATDAERKMLDRVADLVIPRTDTPGASDVGVGDFLVLALNHGLDGTRDPGGGSAAIQGANQTATPHGGMFLLDDLAIHLRIKAGGDFNSATPERQRAAVEAIDAQAFAPGGERHMWHKIKNLILTGYYTSEAGGSQELQYELVPGRWDPDVPLRSSDRAFSSDWTAVDFG